MFTPYSVHTRSLSININSAVSHYASAQAEICPGFFGILRNLITHVRHLYRPELIQYIDVTNPLYMSAETEMLLIRACCCHVTESMATAGGPNQM